MMCTIPHQRSACRSGTLFKFYHFAGGECVGVCVVLNCQSSSHYFAGECVGVCVVY